jgi:two-component system chemotaxis response regulator CheY
LSILDYKDCNVLIADDHLITCKMLEQHLLDMGFSQIDLAADSLQAEEKMAASSYHIVFLDWNMPGKTGYALLQECRQDRQYDDTAFVMVTAESEKRYVIEALKAGSTSYIVKPVVRNVFVEKVDQVMKWLGDRSRTADRAIEGGL